MSIKYINITFSGPHIAMIGQDCAAFGIPFTSKEDIGRVGIELLNASDGKILKVVMSNTPENHKERTKLAQEFEGIILSAIEAKKPEKAKIICNRSRPFSFYMEVSMQGV